MSLLTSSSRRFLLKSSFPSPWSRAMTVLSNQSAEEYKKQNYSKRMKELGRPVSPHVLIYAFPMAAISSITNRVTGCALSMGCAGLGLIEIFGGSGTSLAVMQMVGGSGFAMASTAKLAISFTMSYHYFGALRHLYWDQKPEVLTNVDVEKSSYALFAASGLVSAVSLFF